MKRIFQFFAIASSVGMFMLSSCTKTSEDAKINDVTVQISVQQVNNGQKTMISSGDYVFIDDSLIVTLTCTGFDNNNLATVKLTRSDSTKEMIPLKTITGTSATLTATTMVWDVSGTFTFTANVTGKTGNAATASFSVVMAQMTINSGIVLGSQTGTNFGNFGSAQYQGSYFPSTIAASSNYALDTLIDYCFLIASTPPYTKLASPASSDAASVYATKWTQAPYNHPIKEMITNWPNRHHAYFRLTNITEAAYTVASNSSGQIALLVKNARAAGEPTAESIFLADKSILLYKSDAGKYGLIHVIGPIGTYNPSNNPPEDATGSVQLEILYLH